jgi:hypothetical protein
MQPYDPVPSSMPSAQESDASPSLLEAAELHFETDRLPWQRSLRWARPPRDRRKWALGLLFAALVTVLELVGFANGMRSMRMQPPPPHANEVVQVILLEPELLPPPPPEPEPPAFVKRPSRIAIAPPKVASTPPPAHAVEPSNEMSGRIGAAGSVAPVPQLFNPDGSIRLGAGSAVVAPPPAPKNQQEAAKARWAEIEKRGNPIDCKKTRFAKAFTPDLSLGDKAGKYLKWVGLADPEAIAHRAQQRAESGGCEPAE